MKIVLLAAVCLLTAGCGAYVFHGGGSSPAPSTGTVSGRVLAVPCAPVEQVGSSCAGKPVAGVEIDYVAGTAVIGRTVTDSNGNYAVQIPAGTYAVKFKGGPMRVISGPTSITVAAGSSLVANYLMDSGIRAPVPQQ